MNCRFNKRDFQTAIETVCSSVPQRASSELCRVVELCFTDGVLTIRTCDGDVEVSVELECEFSGNEYSFLALSDSLSAAAELKPDRVSIVGNQATFSDGVCECAVYHVSHYTADELLRVSLVGDCDIYDIDGRRFHLAIKEALRYTESRQGDRLENILISQNNGQVVVVATDGKHLVCHNLGLVADLRKVSLRDKLFVVVPKRVARLLSRVLEKHSGTVQMRIYDHAAEVVIHNGTRVVFAYDDNYPLGWYEIVVNEPRVVFRINRDAALTALKTAKACERDFVWIDCHESSCVCNAYDVVSANIGKVEIMPDYEWRILSVNVNHFIDVLRECRDKELVLLMRDLSEAHSVLYYWSDSVYRGLAVTKQVS